MTLNKTAIETYDRTWNPVTGCWGPGGTAQNPKICEYCYAYEIGGVRFSGSKAWLTGFKPEFHPERLDDPKRARKAYSIFVCSMADLFGNWVPDCWIKDVFAACGNAPKHTYCFLTKNPLGLHRVPEWGHGNNTWFGVSIDGIHGQPNSSLEILRRKPFAHKFVSFEPLIGGSLHFPDFLNLDGIEQVIIGAQTNPYIYPNETVLNIVHQSAREAGCKIFYKDSMLAAERCLDAPRELAWELHKNG